MSLGGDVRVASPTESWAGGQVLQPGSGAHGAGQAAAVPGRGTRPAPPRLLPGGPRRGRGREVGA